MALTDGTYTQAASLQFQDVTISPATVADGTLRQRFDTLAYPQKGHKHTGTHPTTGLPVPAAARPEHGAGS